MGKADQMVVGKANQMFLGAPQHVKTDGHTLTRKPKRKQKMKGVDCCSMRKERTTSDQKTRQSSSLRVND